MATRLLLLGTGTPRYTDGTAQQSSAVIVEERAYLIDSGDGMMVRVGQAIARGVDALAFPRLTRLFLTHLHPDHTAGLPGLMIGPWVMRRSESLHIHGPRGTQALVDGILSAYATGIQGHCNGIAPLNHPFSIVVHEFTAGQVYQDELVRVTAFPVSHGVMEAYGFKFVTADKVIVHAGDTSPVPTVIEQARGCDVLVHEVYLHCSMVEHFGPDWQAYHSAVHTSEIELAAIANAVRPRKLVLNHQLIWGGYTAEDLMHSLTSRYDGIVVFGRDLEMID